MSARMSFIPGSVWKGMTLCNRIFGSKTRIQRKLAYGKIELLLIYMLNVELIVNENS